MPESDDASLQSTPFDAPKLATTGASSPQAGQSLSELLDLPEELRAIVQVVLRNQPVSLADVAAQLQQPTAQISPSLDQLVRQGLLREITLDNQCYYQLGSLIRKPRNLADQIWEQLK
jgi:biotin operon repressor